MPDFMDNADIRDGADRSEAAADADGRANAPDAVRELRLLSQLAVRLAAATSLSESLDNVADALLALDGVDACGVYLLDDATGGLDLVVHRGLPATMVAKVSRFEADAANTRFVLAGESVFVRHDDLLAKLGVARGPGDRLLAIGVVPLRDQHGVVGALNVGSRAAADFPPAARESVLTLAGYVGGALGRLRAERRADEWRRNMVGLLEASDDYIAVSDLGGAILYANPATERALGWARGELIGKRVDDLRRVRGGSDRPRFIATLRQVGSLTLSERLLRRDGAELPVETRLALGKWDGGEVVLALARDLTERTRMQEELVRARKLEALGTLAGGIAQDFNNVLGAILGSAELALAVCAQSGRACDELRNIVDAASRGRDLVGRVLAAARQAPPVLHTVDLARELGLLVEPFRRAMPDGVRLEVELPAEPLLVRCDRGQIVAVLKALVANARDATPEGGLVTLRARLEVHNAVTAPDGMAPGAYALLEVADTGHGMDEPTRVRVFDPFFSTKATGRGVGLGLAMAYGMVRAHHGDISCTSQPGAGATFQVLLPVAAGATGASAADLRATSEPPASLSASILVIEADPAVRHVVARALERCGAAVVEAASGESGIDRLRKSGSSFDLAVLDLDMPGMGGAAAYHVLKALRPSLPVIVTSGFELARRVDLGEVAEIDGFLAKPFGSTELAAEVERVLRIAAAPGEGRAGG